MCIVRQPISLLSLVCFIWATPMLFSSYPVHLTQTTKLVGNGLIVGAASCVVVSKHQLQPVFADAIENRHHDWRIRIFPCGVLVYRRAASVVFYHHQCLFLGRVVNNFHVTGLVVLAQFVEALLSGCHPQGLIVGLITIIIYHSALTQVWALSNVHGQRRLYIQLWRERREACIARHNVA